MSNRTKMAWQRQRRLITANKDTKKYEKTPRGFLMRAYRNMLSRVRGLAPRGKDRYTGLPIMAKEEFYAWALADETFQRLYADWTALGHPRRFTPSVNRIDSSLGYVPGNVEWLTQSENSSLGGKTKSGRQGALRPTPIVCRFPAPAKPAPKNALMRVVAYGDTHFPYHDEASLAIVASVVGVVKPDVLIHMGDLLDCYTLSRYEKDPSRRASLQAEIDMGARHLGDMAMASPAARHILLEGNHPDRLRRVLWTQEGAAQALLGLEVVRRDLTWPVLLNLKESKWEFVPYQEEGKVELLPKMVVKHGHVVRKWSARSAQGEWEAYSRSGMSGHVHRLGQFYHRKWGETNHFWAETGCCCTLDPDYMPNPDWQNGCVVLTIDTTTGAAQVETVNIAKGIAVYRDEVLRA